MVGEVEETEAVEGEVSLLEEGEGVVQGVEEVEAHQGAEVEGAEEGEEEEVWAGGRRLWWNHTGMPACLSHEGKKMLW